MNLSTILRAPSAAGSTKFAHEPPDMVSARGCGHTSPFIPWRLFCSTFFFFFLSLLSISTFALRCPSSERSRPLRCCQLVIYCLNEVQTHAGRHTNIIFRRDCVMGGTKKKEKSVVKNKRLQHRTQQGFCWWVDALSTGSFQETMIALLAFTYISALKQLLL